MINNFKKHIVFYIVFTIIQALGGLLIVLAAGNKQLQLAAILATTLFYFIFAVMHHVLNHDLNKKIVVEYALMGCIGLAFSLVIFNI